jgi:hypothetical protein
MDLLKAASRFTEYTLQHAPKTHERVLREVGDALENSGYSPMVSTFHESLDPTGKEPSFETISDPEYSDIHGGEVSDQTLVDILEGAPTEKAKTIEGLYDVLENIKGDKGLSPATRKMLETFLEKRHAQKPVEEFKPTVLRGRLPPREIAAMDIFERSLGWAKLAKEDLKAKLRNKPNCDS